MASVLRDKKKMRTPVSRKGPAPLRKDRSPVSKKSAKKYLRLTGSK